MGVPSGLRRVTDWVRPLPVYVRATRPKSAVEKEASALPLDETQSQHASSSMLKAIWWVGGGWRGSSQPVQQHYTMLLRECRTYVNIVGGMVPIVAANPGKEPSPLDVNRNVRAAVMCRWFELPTKQSVMMHR